MGSGVRVSARRYLRAFSSRKPSSAGGIQSSLATESAKESSRKRRLPVQLLETPLPSFSGFPVTPFFVRSFRNDGWRRCGSSPFINRHKGQIRGTSVLPPVREVLFPKHFHSD